ncbi:MAG: AraC family transcriptional regulator [Ruthenibacterium sp.]
MRNLIAMQSLLRSQLDQSRLCSFDQEVIDCPTTPLIHQDARFLYVKSGCGEIFLQGKTYPLCRNCLVTILPWQISDITSVTSSLQYVLIAYHFDTIERASKLFHGVDDQPFPIESIMENNPVIQFEESEISNLDYLIESLHRELGMESTLQEANTKPFSSIQTVSLMVQLIVQYCRKAMQQTAKKQTSSIDYAEIFRYIYLHCNEKLTLKILANVFFCSESTVSATITQITGLSFFDLLNEMRIGKTANFLLYTDFTLKEMAEILGYVDESHISKVFSARMGTKIGKYRETYQKIENICQIEESRISYSLTNYIYRNFENELAANDVAHTFGISVSQLNRILICQVERNFESFLNFVRVNRACELLVKTNKNILEIALEVGYSSPKTLTRNFLKLKVTTPSAYRAKATESIADNISMHKCKK